MKRILLFLLVLTASACMPRLYKPQVAAPDAYLNGSGFAHTTTLLSSRWWSIFRDSMLNTLIDKALTNNRDIASAAARIKQARANLGAVRAQYLPQIGLGISAEAEYTPQTKIVQSYAIEPSLSWELSLFGALRHAKDAARAEILTSEWALRGVQLSLAAEVATTYFTLLEFEQDLSIARSSLGLRRESAALIDSMFCYGMSDGVALEQARSLVYTSEADIPLYERSVEQTWLSLCILLGENPSRAEITGMSQQLINDALPDEVPVGLPSELLTRRPDIQQAYYAMKQAGAQAGSARSARFPSITLTGKGGIASGTIKGLTAANPWAWDAAASLVEPLFAFGKLRRTEQAAVAGYKQAAHTYEQSVLEAFGDVESTLVAITTYREQTVRYADLVAANERIATMTEALFRSGLSNYLNVIDAQRQLYDSQMQYINLAAQQRINYVNLCKALGGGW